jgi:hypothetical protein
MANKKINELDSRATLTLSDLMAVGDPSTGYLYKTTISDLKTLTGAGVISFNSRFGAVVPAEGDYSLTQLSDVIITSASNNQVLRYNGSNWVNATIDFSGFVPYTGATGNVNLGTNTLLAAQIKATSSAGLSINANSGTQIADLGAGGGANMTLYGGLTGTSASFSSSVTGNTIVKTGGTSSQFLKADGSVDSSTYLTTSSAASTYVPLTRTLTINGTAYDLTADRTWTIPTHDAVTIGTANGLSLSGQVLSLALASTSATGALSSTDWNTFNGKQAAGNYVTTDTTQTISGAKTFSTGIDLTATDGNYFLRNEDIEFRNHNISDSFRLVGRNLGTAYIYFGASGSNYFGYNGTAFVLNGALNGTSATFSSLTSGYITRAGTNGILQNSLIYDTGTRIAIGGTSATYGVLTVQSDAGQFCVQSNTTPGKQLQIGYDHTTNNSYLTSLNQGVGFTPLLLQPNGGNVGVGTATDNGARFEVKGGYTAFQYNSSASGPTYPSYNTYYGAIGTNFSNGGSELDIWNTVGSGFVFRKQTGASAQTALLTIASTGTATFSSSVTANSNLTGTKVGYNTFDAAGYGVAIGYVSGSYGFISSTGASSPLVLAIDGGEKMRIRNDGITMIGTTTYNSALKGIILNPDGYAFYTANGANVMYLNRLTSDGNILQFQKDTVTTGSISTNTYSLPSDLNFKKNISNLELGLNLVTKLRAVSYNHKIDDDDASLSTGFIAQELEQSLTELGVKENEYYILQHKSNKDKKQSQYWLDYTKMIPVLVKAIQEQQAQIESLKNQLN